MMHVWRSEDSLSSRFSHSTFTPVPGTELRPPGLNSKYFYSLSSLAAPPSKLTYCSLKEDTCVLSGDTQVSPVSSSLCQTRAMKQADHSYSLI